MGSEFAFTEYGPISKRFTKKKLRELCLENVGVQTGPFGTQLHKKDYVKVGTPIITVEHLKDNRISHMDTPFVSDEDKERLVKFSLEIGDIVFSRVGSVDRRALVRELESGWLFSGRCLRVRVDKNLIDPVYLSFFFGHPSFKRYIRSIAVGATMPSINTKILSEMVIYYPELYEQKAIAHILGSLDDKIELNRKMNSTLESMAQALFKSWFVDFDPVVDKAIAAGNPIPGPLQKRAEIRKQLGDNRKPLPADIKKHFPSSFVFSEELGWIPEGWEVALLSELLEVKYGKDHKKLDDGIIPVYGSGGLMRRVNKSLYNGESVLIPRKGTLSNILYVDEEFWTVDTMFYTVPKKIYLPKYVFYHLKRLDFASLNVGSAVPSMTTKILNGLKITKPSAEVLKQFDILLSHFFLKAKANNFEINTLSLLRDTLLPKFLSGELPVSFPGLSVNEPNKKGATK